jgi:hypothetical protein
MPSGLVISFIRGLDTAVCIQEVPARCMPRPRPADPAISVLGCGSRTPVLRRFLQSLLYIFPPGSRFPTASRHPAGFGSVGNGSREAARCCPSDVVSPDPRTVRHLRRYGQAAGGLARRFEARSECRELATNAGGLTISARRWAGARRILAATPVLPMRAHIVQLGLVEIPVFALL